MATEDERQQVLEELKKDFPDLDESDPDLSELIDEAIDAEEED